MATTLTDTNTAAAVARAGEQTTLDPQVLATIRNHYHYHYHYRGADALALARRFHTHETTILRFVVNLATPFTNQPSRTRHPTVEIQQRTSDGVWCTLQGLADFAIVQILPIHRHQTGNGPLRRPVTTVHHRSLATTSGSTLLSWYRWKFKRLRSFKKTKRWCTLLPQRQPEMFTYRSLDDRL
ncbi:MAG TPA: hypothetical protein VJT72_21890 [Pseudonocardiaceae bacterium]|nr:hypothetical protein [Pseudonocardiaceae bacterium]